MKSSLFAIMALSNFAYAQTEWEMGVIDEPNWDKTDHKNNEYLWKL